MNLQDTLYFPGTAIASGSQYPLYLLCPTIHLLQPVEPEEGAGDGPGSADLFINHGFCQVHTPQPLGPDRKRFLRLIDDIRERKDDYAAQLSSLTMAAMTAPRQQDDDTSQAILSSLLGGPGRKIARENEGPKQDLWQARLVLKIGEILDQEEEEIARDLLALDEDEHSLYTRLHGEDLVAADEDDNPLADLIDIRARLRQPATGTIRNRFRAWKQLFLSGELPTWRILATHWPDAADIILEAYERHRGQAATPAGALPLPTTVGLTMDEAFAAVAAFRKEFALLADELLATLPAPLPATLIKRWQDALEQHFPAGQFGRTVVAIHHLAGLDISTLLGKPGQEKDQGTLLLAIADIA
ncbi:hypothetical protein JWG42_16785 [Desulfoprunum benzoelyticum]|uniref:Uncharacterized protein n=1 Tax=Desulfoprunum benzoelyticum TaxID=1506996 RepID=A0A840V1E4_9BACT|nr:hypothetical protein [Desulfoprunum benzoelyticum]MBB5349484.1 hypothetical protein [Desulfoprunum benzoelyticum]MBM9531817.1 hypothetical protein [Desulfoprunum benzoelyticum]